MFNAISSTFVYILIISNNVLLERIYLQQVLMMNMLEYGIVEI